MDNKENPATTTLIQYAITAQTVGLIIRGYASLGQKWAHALVSTAAVKSLIQGYVDLSVTKWTVEGNIANFYIQDYRSRKDTRLKVLTQVGHMVVTLITLDTPMTDIGQLRTDIEENTGSLFYIIREGIHTRENPSLHDREKDPIWKGGNS